MVPVVTYRILREENQTLALGYVVFRGALEKVTYMATAMVWLSLLALRHGYGQAGPPNAAGFQALSTVLLEGEAISSVTTIVFTLGAAMFYYVLYRSKLVPRWISGWGLIAAVPHLTAGFLVVLGAIGHLWTVDAVLRLQLGLQEMVLAVWLIVRGFDPRAIAAGFARRDAAAV
jgi:hypothetical protein